MDKETILKQIETVEHAIEEAKHGQNDSTLWYEDFTKPWANGYDSYGDWIDAEFAKLREYIKTYTN